MDVLYTQVKKPEKRGNRVPVFLSDETMKERLSKVITMMKEKELDSLFVYADTEHGLNFEYLAGFSPRFEEALLVLHQNQEAYLILGNENTNMIQYSRLKASLIHCPFLSLPYQPMEDDKELEDYFKEAKLDQAKRIGVVGWKVFTSKIEDNSELFDLPYFILDALFKLVVKENVINVTKDFYPLRYRNNPNEIAHYEFGSALCSDAMMDAIENIEVGKTEMEIGNYLSRDGQRPILTTIAAFGNRFENANFYPTNKKIKLQDKASLTIAYKGGNSSRSGYVVRNENELPEDAKDYLDVVCFPYFKCLVNWLENIHIGMTGDQLYQLVNENLPNEQIQLNPGHLIADEEWLTAFVYKGSETKFESGMLVQTEIIFAKDGYAKATCESGILLADEKLRNQLKEDYPELYQVMLERREYVRNELNISLSDEILPTCDNLAYFQPFLLNKEYALKKG